MRSRIVFIAVSIVAAVATPVSYALAQDARQVDIELNKLEPAGDACRAYVVIKNGTTDRFTSMKLDVVMFDTDGIVSKRLAVEAAPLAAEKTVLKVFNISNLPCTSISRVLLNDIVSCTDQSGDRDDCVAISRLSSRGDVEFVK